MRPLRIALWSLSLLPVWATALPLARSARWWVRIWDYPRPQVSIALALAAVGQAWLLPRRASSRGLLTATLGCLAWQLSRIYSYTPLFPVEVAQDDSGRRDAAIGIVVVNVLQHNRNSSTLLRRIEDADPDVVLAVETNHWWDAELEPLRARYPYVVRHPLENTYGMHLFSRLELGDVRLFERVSRDIPSLLVSVRLRSGTCVNLHCVHPEPPRVGNDVEERDAELLLVAREVAAASRPTIVCGDLNDVAWSHTTRLFQRISGLLDPRIGRGTYPTFHAKYWFARWPLDHVFHDPSFRLERLEILDAFGSDHFPVHVVLVHDANGASEQEAPPADAGDRQEAAEKIGEGLRS